jgi:multicomponent Na+:H+ antiporter subunit G
MSGFVEWIAVGLVLAGAFFVLVAALGVLRLGDVYLRMHASTKAGTLGLGLIVIAIMMTSPEPGAAAKAGAVLIFMLITTPIGAHLVGRAVFRAMSEAEREACRPEVDAND